MLRILSDLHFRDATSRLRRLPDLAPVLDGVSELWINGDSCDNQTGMPAAAVEELKTFFTERVPSVRFITGNHDPDISSDHFATAANGRLCATHGDAFFDDIAPWSRARPILLERLAAQHGALPSRDFSLLDDRMAIIRSACSGMARETDPECTDALHLTRRTLMEFFPPRQPWAMVRSWWTFPARVRHHAARWWPEAKVVVAGHIHFPHVWHRGPLTIINTGAFSGPLGALAVDYADEQVTVRRLRQQAGRWHLGRTVASIPLASVASPALSNRP